MHWVISGFLLLFSSLLFAEPVVIPHDPLPSFNNNGNTLTGVATPKLGAMESEVWHSSIAAGSETPPHTHAAEEIVILVAGTLDATVDGVSSTCSAPCTIILPANKMHTLKNTGNIPTSHFLVMPSKSHIFNADGHKMELPWRQ